MKIFIDEFRCVDGQPVVITDISPSDVRRFRIDAPSMGSASIVYCGASFPKQCVGGSHFTLSPSQFSVLNVGSSHKTYLVFDGLADEEGIEVATERHETNHPYFHGSEVIRGDAHFKNSLPSHLKDLGLRFLEMVRNRFDGELIFHPKSKKFVESPNNFWAVIIQPRDKSLRVTVKGRSNDFVVPYNLELKPDLSSYSAFKVNEESQLDSAIEIITKAASN